jgi:hypothetical protein
MVNDGGFASHLSERERTAIRESIIDQAVRTERIRADEVKHGTRKLLRRAFVGLGNPSIDVWSSHGHHHSHN